MALMQISEPGASRQPHQKKHAVGIDLGTTNSLVATVRSGKAEALPDDQGRAIVPSVVHYAEQEILVGEAGKPFIDSDPHNTIVSIKRLMGRSFAEVKAAEHLHGLELKEDSGLPTVQTRQGDLSPVQVSAAILMSLRQRAEQSLGDAIDGVVITVPAYFDDGQRQATKDAAKIAGLPLMRLINEPTAAAMAYGLDKGVSGVHLVFDLGGGTFDVSILRLSEGVLEVVATGGDSLLGGDDFDQVLAEKFLNEHSIALNDKALQRQLLSRARVAKEKLTSQVQASIEISVDQKDLKLNITQEEFAEWSAPLMQRIFKVVKRTLRDARVTADDIDEVVLVGGSTRMPIVQDAVGEFFNKSPLAGIDPDQVVALGAALQADRLVGNRPKDDKVLLDVVPLSLGIETMGNLCEKIIKRNTAIPITRAQEFTTYQDGQTAMALHVVQGERELADENRSLARFELRGIPPMAAGTARIRVTFAVDADGMLAVSAKELSTNIEAQIEVKPSYGLSDKQITDMLEASITHAKHDIETRQLAEQRVAAHQMLTMLKEGLEKDKELVSPEEFNNLVKRMDELEQLVQGDDHKAIKDAIKQLNEASENFANLRMNKGIQAALIGQNIESQKQS